MKKFHCGLLSEKEIGKQVELFGWVRGKRGHAGLIFIDLADRSGIVQLVVEKKSKVFPIAEKLMFEFVVRIKGKVKKRMKDNPNLPTGKIEIEAEEIEILNESEPLPFEIIDAVKANEDTRLKYRYLDLRRPIMQKNLLLRHNIVKAIREFFYEQNFIEVETPIFTKSTPEGARDYIVPSRPYPGKVWALPQSPQIYKQLLMVSGFEKYFQIAKCMRDEDLRGDRQPEFSQLDLEMSFVEQEDIFELIESLLKKLFKEVLQKDLKTPFPRMSYADAIKKYKSDKPDTRNETKQEFSFLWVTDFPLFQFSEEDKRIVSEHHPFTAPKKEDIKFLEKEPLKVRSTSYDLVMNGVELCSGSIRIHDSKLQAKIFKTLGLTEKETQEKFSHIITAFKYGAPPHGGIALGLDRFIMLLAKQESIRDVIAFPKNGRGIAMLEDAPSSPDKKQLDELGLQWKK